MKNYKFKIKNWVRAAVLLPFAFCVFNCSAVYLQPFWYHGVDQFGSPVTNAITIESWPPTNSIIGNNTNVVISVPHTFLPDVNGFVSNNIAVGSYHLKILNFSLGVPFTISSNATPVDIAQSAGVPIVMFANFTLAQFSDAGTMAYRSTNDFTLAANTGTIARRASNDFFLASSAGTIAGRASNDFFLAASAGTIAGRASNDFFLAASAGSIAGRASNDFFLAASAGSIAGRGSNDFHLADGNIGLQSGSIASIASNGFGAWVFYKTNNDPGPAFTNLPMGSLMSTTNGQFYVLSNIVWRLK